MNKTSFFIVGQHAVIEALRNPNRKVLRVFLTEEAKKNIHKKNPKKNVLEDVKVYYKSKKEVYLSLVDHWVKKYNAGFIENLEQNNNASEQLRGLFDYFLDQYDNDPAAFKILVEFWSLSGRDKDFNEKLQKVYSDFLEYLTNLPVFSSLFLPIRVASPDFGSTNIRLEI